MKWKFGLAFLRFGLAFSKFGLAFSKFGLAFSKFGLALASLFWLFHQGYIFFFGTNCSIAHHIPFPCHPNSTPSLPPVKLRCHTQNSNRCSEGTKKFTQCFLTTPLGVLVFFLCPSTCHWEWGLLPYHWSNNRSHPSVHHPDPCPHHRPRISYFSQLPLPFLLLCDCRLPCSFRKQRII